MAATVAADKAAVETAKINLEYTSIYSPINGRTGSVGVKEGNLVKANVVPILVTINQIEPIYVSFSIPEQQLAELKQYSNSKSLKVDAAPQGSTQHFQGRLTFIDNSVDLTTGTIKLKATFDNAAHVLWPGQFADVNLTLKSQPNAACGADCRAANQPERHIRICGGSRPHGQAAAGKSRLERGRGHGDCFRLAAGTARGDRRPVAPDARRQSRYQERIIINRSINMNTQLFIRRPITTTLIMAAILIFGVFAYRLLPVSDLPNVDFPTIQVNASLPGASPETMAAAVALPLEKQFSTIAGLDSMTSSSALGGTSITLQFTLDHNIDAAAQDVQAMIAKTALQLPPELPSPPSYQKVNPADQPVLYLALAAPTMRLSDVDEAAQTTVAQRLSMVSGVAQVQVFGTQKYAVRAQLDPRALAARQIGIDEVASAISNANVNLPTGRCLAIPLLIPSRPPDSCLRPKLISR